VNDAAPRGFIPPQPNLGPEPWPAESPAGALFFAIGAAACLLVGWLVWRGIGRRQRRDKPGHLAGQVEPDDTPRGRLLALAQSIREAMNTRFGAPWRAKTTEELSVDAELEQVIGREGLEELIRFLDQVDRLKFAPERLNHRHESLERELAAWQPKLTALKARIEAREAGRRKTGNAAPPRAVLQRPFTA
jgi:hypothetical protein